jgi:hypothetical protein
LLELDRKRIVQDGHSQLSGAIRNSPTGNSAEEQAQPSSNLKRPLSAASGQKEARIDLGENFASSSNGDNGRLSGDEQDLGGKGTF